ncbi:LOW QUALITY PROTEIN: Helitron helicase-like protein [Phytophthora palmivora]|uniref:Helitron helicase-like protein n=1 Tax=Phytophthora palmivora TaxID=4796 RepID=A0A2P4YIA4_9STRA|nr:LOW QUALITY PROTEIN: Helitron helicase-like protein [Phytophthora palmivora]
MTPSKLARVRAADAERERRARANRSGSQIDRDRQQDAQRARARRALMNPGEVEGLRETNRVCQSNQRNELSNEQRELQKYQDTEAHGERREGMSLEERQTMRDEDTAARRATREAMTEDERQDAREHDAEMHRRRYDRGSTTDHTRSSSGCTQAIRDAITEEDLDRRREGERFRRRSRKYQKGFAYYEEFDPVIIPGGRHYFSRYTDETLEHERVCQHCGAWKFPDETEGRCCRKGLVNVPHPREAPAELDRLFGNPRFKQSIRAYNNVFAFTSMGSSRTHSLNVDERVTRSGVYNFHVQGSVCHRMGGRH